MVDRIEKVVYVTKGGREFDDHEEAHREEAIERLTTMLYELRYHDPDDMAKALLTHYVELKDIIEQHENGGQ